jgi:hypothetical protein
VVALARTVSDRFLKREILLPPEEIEAAYRGIRVRSVDDGVHGDAHAAIETQRSGGIPTGCQEGRDDIRLAANEGDIERIARDAGSGFRQMLADFQIGVMADFQPLKLGDGDVGDDSVNHERTE